MLYYRKKKQKNKQANKQKSKQVSKRNKLMIESLLPNNTSRKKPVASVAEMQR